MSPLQGYAVAGALLLIVASAAGGYKRGYTHAIAGAEVLMSEHLRLDREAELARQIEVRNIERDLADANALVSESYEQGKKDAKIISDAVAADLRSGTVRLQQRWASCNADRLSGAAAASSELDAATRDREESAARIVLAAAECDAQVGGLQAFIRSQREILNKR